MGSYPGLGARRGMLVVNHFAQSLYLLCFRRIKQRVVAGVYAAQVVCPLVSRRLIVIRDHEFQSEITSRDDGNAKGVPIPDGPRREAEGYNEQCEQAKHYILAAPTAPVEGQAKQKQYEKNRK